MSQVPLMKVVPESYMAPKKTVMQRRHQPGNISDQCELLDPAAGGNRSLPAQLTCVFDENDLESELLTDHTTIH